MAFRATIAFIAVFLVPPAFVRADDEARHNNRVSYGDIATGMRDIQFLSRYQSMKETAKGSFLELERRAQTDFSLDIRRPKKTEAFDALVKKIPAKVVAVPEIKTCDSPVKGVFLALPRREGEDEGKGMLYSYDYLVCAGEGVLEPKKMLEKYMEKYGNYDEKDFDRNVHNYHNVQGRYRVGVRPFASKEGFSGLIITVTDYEVFRTAYETWRGHVRQVENRAKRKF